MASHLLPRLYVCHVQTIHSTTLHVGVHVAVYILPLGIKFLAIITVDDRIIKHKLACNTCTAHVYKHLIRIVCAYSSDIQCPIFVEQPP